jgi:hypothetical protein
MELLHNFTRIFIDRQVIVMYLALDGYWRWSDNLSRTHQLSGDNFQLKFIDFIISDEFDALQNVTNFYLDRKIYFDQRKLYTSYCMCINI